MKNKQLAFNNTSRETAELIREELSAIESLDRGKTRMIPGLDLRFLDLSGRSPPESFPRAAVRVEPASPEKPVAFVSRCEWERARQSFQVIRTDEKTFWIIGGGAEGVLYGFYAFLKRFTGIRWYSISEEDTVFAEPAEDTDIVSRPAIVFRGFEFSIRRYDRPFIMSFLRWMARNNLNILNINAGDWAACPWRDELVVECRRRGIRIAGGCHAVDYFLPESEFSAHPEFFGLREGKRCLRAPVFAPDVRGGVTSTRPIQPCYTNPATRARMARAASEFLTAHPEVEILSVWPHDGMNNWCQCPDCLRATPYEMLYMLAMDIMERNVSVPVEVLCYANSLNLPRRRLPESDRTYTLFCLYLRQHKHSIFDPGFDPDRLTLGRRYPDPEPINPSDDREYGLLLERWLPRMAETGSQLGVYAYYQLVFHDETGASDRSRFIYHPEPGLVSAEVKKFHQCGAKLFYDCAPPPVFWPDSRHYAYFPGILWDPEADAGALVMEYYQAAMGGKAGSIVSAMSAISALLADRSKPGVPKSKVEEARKILETAPGARGDRYAIWLDYLLQADRARQAVLSGRPEEAIAIENGIRSFFENHRSVLVEHINVDWMRNYSRAAISYHSK